MSFWNALRHCHGPTNFAVSFFGTFAGEVLSEGGHVGGLDIYTYNFGPNVHYQLSNWYAAGPALVEARRVFVLAWMRDGITEVTFQTLEGYDYFLTSEFSGCRFVVTEYGVSHVSWSAGRRASTWEGSQQMRDVAEVGAMTQVPCFRRRLSISGGPGLLDALLSASGRTNSTASYDGQNERVMIFGYKEGGVWHFKMLTYPIGGGSQAGTWTTFI